MLNNVGRRHDWHRSYGTRGRFVFRSEKREHVQERRFNAEDKRTCKEAPIQHVVCRGLGNDGNEVL